MPVRRFPPPWTAEVTPNCFIVRDADGQQLAYVYYESEPGPLSGKVSQRGRGAADCQQHRQAAGAIAEALSFSAAIGGAVAIPIEVTIGPAPFTCTMASLA
jgi:hypothetical protein